MKSFVTGANGFTGSHLVKALEKRGDSVMGLVRKSSDLSRLADTNVELIYGDITDRSTLQKAIQKVDTIFHTAAYVELGLVDAARMEQVNVEGTRSLLEVAQSANVSKMVYCSTIGIFGDTQGKVIDETFQRVQKNFSSAYDRTKYEAQQLVDRAAAQGFPVVSVMPSGIFGLDDPHFMPVLNSFLKGRLKVWAGGDRMTGVVHVDDLAELMMLAAQKGKTGQYYIASAGDLSTREMFQIFSQETGISPPYEVPELIVRVAGTVLDVIGRSLSWQPPIDRERVHYVYDRCVRVTSDKARRELGWNPRSVEATLKELVANRASQTTQ
ncbi:NAD-dependent epimerase/dehydratase family protein [Phormidesmis priestleyi]